MTTKTNLKNKIEADGYAIVPNVLTQKEVCSLRRALKKHFVSQGVFFSLGLVQPNAAHYIREIEWLCYHPKIIEAFRVALGQDDIVFTGHCDAHHNIFCAWHKDDGGGNYFEGDYFTDDNCRVYKAAIYLQDRPQFGISVRRGSHRFASLTAGEIEYCSTKAGDIVVFDVRLTHRGQPFPSFECLLYKAWSKIPLLCHQNRWFYRLRMLLKKGEDRSAIFFAFGIPNQFTEYFAIADLRRQNRLLGETVIDLPALVEKFHSIGIKTSNLG